MEIRVGVNAVVDDVNNKTRGLRFLVDRRYTIIARTFHVVLRRAYISTVATPVSALVLRAQLSSITTRPLSLSDTHTRACDFTIFHYIQPCVRKLPETGFAHCRGRGGEKSNKITRTIARARTVSIKTDGKEMHAYFTLA